MLLTKEDLRYSVFKVSTWDSIWRSIHDSIDRSIWYSIHDSIEDPIQSCIWDSAYTSISRRLEDVTN